jgi:HD superfamily phosphohydrolase
MTRTYRLRDPVHGLIVFKPDDPVDQLAWALLNTGEFQRLRRVKQLGVSEFVFPGATHTRFAHCIGVFHTARLLIQVIERELRAKNAEPDGYREKVATVAALLHDIGHGPFSHAFEHAYASVRKARGRLDEKSHEDWTAEIILNQDGGIRPLLDNFAREHVGGRPFASDIADLLTRENPEDIYHAVVSSSFDADRLDYLRRDRLMTGSGAGAIDFDWLLDNLTVADIDAGIDDDGANQGMRTPSFCLRERAIQAAEAFVLARYHLYFQVYLHKTTRCVEAMIDTALARFAQLCAADAVDKTGLVVGHPLSTFFAAGGDTLANYVGLDDTLVWSAFAQMRLAEDESLKDLAGRILDRRLYKVLDIDSAYDDDEQRRRAIVRVRQRKAAYPALDILSESPRISAYGEGGADDTKAHNRIMIVGQDGRVTEITQKSPVVKALETKSLHRFFFKDEAVRAEMIKG